MNSTALYVQLMVCLSSSELPAAHRNRIAKTFFELYTFMCPLQGLGLLGSLGHIPLYLDPHSLQGVYFRY